MSTSKIKGQGHQGQKAHSAADTPVCVLMVCARCKQRETAAEGPISWLPGGVVQLCRPAVLRRWENQRSCFFVIFRSPLFASSRDLKQPWVEVAPTTMV